MKILVTSALILLFTSNSFAHCGWYTDRTVVKSSVTFTTAVCSESTPLALVRTSHSYPRLGTLEVDAWQGEFARPAVQTDVIRSTTHRCDGSVLRQWTYTDTNNIDVLFAIENPNLDDGVSSTFEANAPMTDQEAINAMTEALKACAHAK